MGERITGWAASHLQPIANSDPALDLGPLAGAFRSRLRSALVIPLTTGDRLLGVVSAYAIDDNAFRSDHRYAVEEICGTLSAKLEELLQPEAATLLKFSPRKA